MKSCYIYYAYALQNPIIVAFLLALLVDLSNTLKVRVDYAVHRTEPCISRNLPNSSFSTAGHDVSP